MLLIFILLVLEGSYACQLTSSGPVSAVRNNQVIEYLNIKTTSGTPAVTINGFSNVIVRNCEITHTAQTSAPFGIGISISSSPNFQIINVTVDLTPHDSGPLPSWQNHNILVYNSPDGVFNNVKTTGGSTGIELHQSNNVFVSGFVAINMRGPFPRGQCLQTDHSDNVWVENFYCYNDNTSWTEDNFNLWRSSNVTVRNGLVDGNNSPTGVGVMFEQDDPTKKIGAL